MASMWRRAMHYLGLGPDDEYEDYDDEYEAPEQRPLANRPPTRYPSSTGVPRAFGEPRSSVRTLAPSLGDDTHPNGALNGNGVHHDEMAERTTASARAARGDRERLDRDRDAMERDRGERDRRDRADRDRADRADRADRGERDRDRSHDRPGDRPADRLAAAGRPRPATVRALSAPPSRPHVVSPSSFNDAQEIGDEFKGSVPVILNLQGVQRDLARRIIDFASGLCYALDGQMERVANQVYLLTPNDMEVSAEERRRLQERGYEA
jgi:cell division inhibitor SepF